MVSGQKGRGGDRPTGALNGEVWVSRQDSRWVGRAARFCTLGSSYEIRMTAVNDTYFGNLIFYHSYQHALLHQDTQNGWQAVRDSALCIITSWPTLTLPFSVSINNVPRVSQTAGLK